MATAAAGTLSGFVRDANWYARYQNNPPGVGYYEYGVNADALSPVVGYGAAATDVFGRFSMPSLPAGLYTVASWDVWWRSAYAFNVVVPASGASPSVDLRLRATMWGYPAFWDDAGYYEFGQTFVATGPISMIYLRIPLSRSYTLTMHEYGPGGPQIGQSRTFNGGDQRPIYGYGDLPTVAGRTYYARIRTASLGSPGVIMQMDPRPDFSDPMPGGCLWLGASSLPAPYPDRDLGLVIMADDDGLITNLQTRSSGAAIADATNIGQTFVARGIGLISAAFWLADPSAPTYEVRLRKGGPGGAQVGSAKRGKPPRVTADPEMIVTWAPGECPLLPGQTFYAEVTRADGGVFYQAYVNRSDPFLHGQAYRNGAPMTGLDLAGTLMEEAGPGEAARPKVRFLSDPAVAEADRGTNQWVVRWTTDVASDSHLEYAPGNPPYTAAVLDTNLVQNHALTVTDLWPQTLYHFRVTSSAPGHRPALSRDLVLSTRNTRPNLLVNGDFETGSGASPRKTIPGWTKTGNLDMGLSDGTWFGELKPRSGKWLFQGALNGSSSDAYLSQRVTVIPGRRYALSAWVLTKALEKINGQVVEKYDVWNDRNRLIYARLGLDPLGGTSPAAASIRWTPRAYSHLHYSNFGLATVATNSLLTVYVHLKGDGVEWHLYGVDDCVLTEAEAPPPRLFDPTYAADGTFAAWVGSEAGTSARLEVSPDLTNWTPLKTVLNGTGTFRFEDHPADPLRFYRVVAPVAP